MCLDYYQTGQNVESFPTWYEVIPNSLGQNNWILQVHLQVKCVQYKPDLSFRNKESK